MILALFYRGHMTGKVDARKIDESLRLVAAFMHVKDEKARSEIIKLAEMYAQFERDASLFQSPDERIFG